MVKNILKNIYLDIYNAPRDSNRSLDNKIKQFRNKLGRGSELNKKGVILVDPVNLMPIKVIASKKTEGDYKIFNKLAEKIPKAKYLDLFKVSHKNPPVNVKKVVPSNKNENRKKELKPCPEGTIRNPKTRRCKKIVIVKNKNK